MKKFIYISAILLSTALVSTSCKNEEPDLFDQSAAERIEAAVRDYETALTADGGKWMMEYFTNPDESGYVYIVTFSTDGSVQISGKNKWIGNTFKTENSLWDVISDNGPVLSFSSYNTIFHIFANPEDYTDPDAGAGSEDSDIDQTGYGHEGDYEFVLMEASENLVRLKGKKYGETIYLHKLAADTNDETYFAELDAAKEKMFNSKFPTLILTDGTGEQFVMTGTEKGVVSFYPKAGDAITQTVTANAIITSDGIRFSEEVGVARANATDSIYFQTFKYQENGLLVCSEDNNMVITAPALSDLITDIGYTWTVDPADMGGAFATAYAAAEAEFKTVYKNKRNLKSVSFSMGNNQGVMSSAFQIQAGTAKAYVFTTLSAADANSFSVAQTGEFDSNAKRFLTDIKTLQPMLDQLSQSYKLSTESLLVPSRIKVVSTTNENDYFYVTVQ